ncbi:CHASE2 domain-containing sensor protein [Thalassobacillus pellis]|nr:CHASE2 domain-containing sensor protein [Thalassobacillus pellis]
MFFTQTRKWPISILLIISCIGLFCPWFYFSPEIDYTSGWHWVAAAPTIFIGLVGALMFIWKSRWVSFAALSMVPLSCVYLFFSWHVPTITGELSFRISYENTHYGFYVTLLASLLAMPFYINFYRE